MSSDDPRTRILDAAGPIFAEKGFDATTVREICQAAGVNLAAVNYHFGGKDRLYQEALRHAHPADFRPAGGFDWPRATDARQKLRQFIRSFLEHLLSVKGSPWQERLFVREMLDPTPAFLELVREHFRTNLGQLDQVLDGLLPPAMPLHKRHQIALSIVGQCLYYRSSRNVLPLIVGEEELHAYFSVEQLADHIAEFTLAALGLATPLGGAAGRHSGEGGASSDTSESSPIAADPCSTGDKVI